MSLKKIFLQRWRPCLVKNFSHSPSIGAQRLASCGPIKSLSNDETMAFKNILPDLIKDLTVTSLHREMPGINEHLAKSIDYNLTNGKLNRGLTVPLTLKILTESSERSLLKEAFILGWCIEFLQAFFLVADDMMDGSTTRRGKSCWYLHENLGMKAINDAILLETCIYTLLDKYFKDKSFYLNLLDAFLHTTRHTAMGQQLDLMSSDCSLEEFDIHRYTQIVEFKTSYYSFYLPVQLGMILSGINDPDLYKRARTILLAMGHYFQVQDDFLDCYGDPNITGKVGTDIQDGKCSWLVVKAMEKADQGQKQLLKECYGKSDLEDVAKVKELYKQLNIDQVYKAFEEESHQEINRQINDLQGLNHDVFHSFLARIYKRNA